MTITLPDSHRAWLEDQAARLGSSVDRVVTQLIEEAWETDEVEAKVLEAVAGPSAEPMTRTDWERLRARVKSGPAPAEQG